MKICSQINGQILNKMLPQLQAPGGHNYKHTTRTAAVAETLQRHVAGKFARPKVMLTHHH